MNSNGFELFVCFGAWCGGFFGHAVVECMDVVSGWRKVLQFMSILESGRSFAVLEYCITCGGAWECLCIERMRMCVGHALECAVPRPEGLCSNAMSKGRCGKLFHSIICRSERRLCLMCGMVWFGWFFQAFHTHFTFGLSFSRMMMMFLGIQ
jgi:hypothetical protein